MKKRFIIGLTLFVFGTLFSTAKAGPSPFPHHPHGKHGIHHHSREIRHDKREIRKDKMVRDYHIHNGHKGMAAKKQHDIHRDRKELRHDRKHRHHHVRHHHHH